MRCAKSTPVWVLLPLHLCLAGPAEAQIHQHLQAIEVLSNNPDDSTPGRMFEKVSVGPIQVDLDLGESIENRIIVLHPQPGTAKKFKVEQQFETSLSVSAEGSHLDLMDWKHYYSPWRALKNLGGNRFLTAAIDPSESVRFPRPTPEEIRAAVLKAGGAEWADLVRNIKTPHDSPVSVGVSKVSFRIMVREGNKWRVIKRLDFLVPMGC